MHVTDGLTAVRTRIDDQTISALAAALRSQFRRDRNHPAGECGARQRCFMHRAVMCEWHYEQMRGCLRVEVFDGNHVIVTVNHARGYLSAPNLAENAVVHERVRIVKFHDFVVVLPARSATRTIT